MTVVHLLEPAGDGLHLYGKERVVASLAEAQRAIGMDARIVTFRPSPLATDHCANDLGAGFLAAIDRANPRVVHSHGYKANIVARALRVRRPKIGLVATCHGFVNTTNALAVYNALDRYTAWASHRVTVTAPAMLARFPAFTHPAYVPNAIADAAPIDAGRRARARARFAIPNDALVVGTIARLSPEKGLATLAEAAGTVPAARWIVAGEGPERRTLAGSGLELLGYVDPADDAVAAFDVFVQASYTEGLSLALLEAMRAGLPIVATRVGATGDALVDRRDAFLIDPYDARAIGEAVALFAADASVRARYGAAARARFVERYTLAAHVERFSAIYASIF